MECGRRGTEVVSRCVAHVVREIRESVPSRSQRCRIVVSRIDRFACQRDRRFTIPWFSPTRCVADGVGNCQISLCEFVVRIDCADDVIGNTVLQLENVVECALKPISPDMPARRRLDQLPGDPHPPASTPDTPLQYVAHTQLAPYLLDVDRATLVR